MSDSVRIQTGDIEPITVLAQTRGFELLTGLADLFVKILRDSDGQYLDWDDDTFKASGWVTLSQVLAEVDATNAPGLYEVTGGFDTGAITNAAADDTYLIIVTQTADTAVIPPPGEIKVGQWTDDLTDIQAQADKIDDAATTAPASATTGSLLDRLANKNGSKTFSSAVDSLEAIRDRVG